MFKPKKLAQIQISNAALKQLTNWLIEYASRKKITDNIDLSKRTLLRYIKKLKAKETTIDQLFTVRQIQALIDLENADWRQYKNPTTSTNSADPQIQLKQQEKELTKTLKRQGWGLNKQSLEFASMLRMLEGDAATHAQGMVIFEKWSPSKQAQYLTYQKQVSAHE